jgi:hypothetical protein
VSLTVQQITERLEAIEEETEKKSGPGERAAENHARLRQGVRQGERDTDGEEGPSACRGGG